MLKSERERKFGYITFSGTIKLGLIMKKKMKGLVSIPSRDVLLLMYRRTTQRCEDSSQKSLGFGPEKLRILLRGQFEREGKS